MLSLCCGLNVVGMMDNVVVLMIIVDNLTCFVIDLYCNWFKFIWFVFRRFH